MCKPVKLSWCLRNSVSPGLIWQPFGAAFIRENIISTLSEDTDAEIAKTKELTAAVQDLEAAKKEAGIEEDEDKEPTKADLKKTKGLAKAKEELALLTREMKALARKYSKAEGIEKEQVLLLLKSKTKLKKELENILDK